MVMNEKFIEINGKVIPIITNEIESEKILIYIHGLGGTAKESRPIFKNITDFTIISVKQRGHENEANLKASRFFKKYLIDIFDIILFYKKQNKKIFLLGESMGGAFSSLISYYFKDAVEYVFVCAIPNKLTNIFLESKFNKFIINSRTALTYLFNWNYKFRAKLDFDKITNNKNLKRIAKINSEINYSQTRNIISAWNAIRVFWRIAKKNNPNSKILFFYGSEDVMLKQKKIYKKLYSIKIRNDNFDFLKIEGSKHVLLYEKNSEKIFVLINKIMSEN